MIIDIPPIGARCQVWWADIAAARAAHLTLLDEQEAARHSRLRRDFDRDRLVVGAALARLVLARHLGCEPQAVRLDRTCAACTEPHGKPRVMAVGAPELSVSHAGTRVAVAFAAGFPVGVDVERVDAGVDLEGLADQVLSPVEMVQARDDSGGLDRINFFRCWTRKESVLKATGDGLRVPMNHLHMSPPGEPPVLHAWQERPQMPARIRLVDLSPGAGYVASLAALDAPRLDVTELDATDLLGTWRPEGIDGAGS